MASIQRSNHILPTSANLLGFTFVVLTSIHGLGLAKDGIIPSLTGGCVILFAFSTLLSFLSLRNEDHKTMINYEKWAEYTFLGALIICTALSIILVFDIA